MFIDTHCHLDFSAFDADREAVIQRAKDAGVDAVFLPAIARSNWQTVDDLAQDTFIKPAFGLHPMFMAEHKREHLDELESWLHRHQAIAIGECGLDFYIEHDRQEQIEFFEAQVALAQKLGKPLIIHARKALDEVLSVLRRHAGVRGILHSFSGSDQQARQALDLGFVLGVGGPVTYERAQRLRKQIQSLSLSAFVLETDAPDQPLHGHQGSRNEPAKVKIIAEAMADLRGVSVEEIARITCDTVNTIVTEVELY